jgi:hypothetical protein
MDLVKLIKLHGGRWVALKPNSNKVLSSGKNIKQVYSNAQKKGVAVPTLFKVPKKYIPNIG